MTISKSYNLILGSGYYHLKAKRKENKVCSNCGQWKRPGRNGYLDCMHECTKRGFEPKEAK